MASVSMKLIDTIPDHAMQWLGVFGQGTPDMRSPEHLEAGITAGTAFTEKHIQSAAAPVQGLAKAGTQKAMKATASLIVPGRTPKGGDATANAAQSASDVSAKKLPDFGANSSETKKE